MVTHAKTKGIDKRTKDLRKVFRKWREKMDRPTVLDGGWVRGKYGCWYDPEYVAEREAEWRAMESEEVRRE